MRPITLPILLAVSLLACGAPPEPKPPAPPPGQPPLIEPTAPEPAPVPQAEIPADGCPAGATEKTEKTDRYTTTWCETPAGVKHGRFARDFADGREALRGGYDAEGRRHGEYTRWSEDGRILDRGRFEHGQRTGPWTHWDAANRKRTGPVKRGAPQGHWTYHDDQDRVRQEGPYEQGVRHGAWVFRDDKGNEIGRGSYVEGRLELCEGECPLFGDLAEVREAVRARRADTRACYHRALQSKPDLAGSATLAWQVGTDGRPKDVAATRSDLGPELTDCLVQVVGSMRLPKPAVPLAIERVFSFSPQSRIRDALQASGCSPKALRPVVRQHQHEVKACLAQHVAWPPDAPGAVKMGWRLDSRGVVSAFRGITGEDALHGCLRERVESWTFPATDGAGCQVEYEVTYGPEAAEEAEGE